MESTAPPSKPKRPLSAFNLFYRFKRQKVLEVVSGLEGRDDNATIDPKAAIIALVQAAPGVEGRDDGDPKTGTPSLSQHDLRRAHIRRELEHNLLPRDTRDRTHRTNQSAMNGTMSFLELGRLMNTSWKNCDDFAKGVFNELSEEGREHYRRRLAEFSAAQATLEGDESEEANKSNAKSSKGKSKKERSAPGGNDNAPEVLRPAVTNSGIVGAMSHPIDPSMYSGANNLTPQTLVSNSMVNPHHPHQAMRTAYQPVDHSLRTVSRDYGPPQEYLERQDNHQAHLMLRVRALEGQLATERLQRRVLELEGQIGRHRSMEERMLTQLGVVARNGPARNGSHCRGTHDGPAAPLSAPSVVHSANQRGGHPPSSAAQNGLWSLASASMIHPTSARAPVDARMAGDRHPALGPRLPTTPRSQCQTDNPFPQPPPPVQGLGRAAMNQRRH